MSRVTRGLRRGGARVRDRVERGPEPRPATEPARISPSVTVRGTTSELPPVLGGTTETEHLARGSRETCRGGKGVRPAARRALGKPGARRDGCAAGSSVGFVARRSFCCAVNELVQGVRARFTEGCVFDFCKTTPFLYAYTFPL